MGAIGVEDYAKECSTLYGRKFVTPAIAGVVAADTRVEVIREGFEGTEGPIALVAGSILFTENRADRIVKVAPDNSVSTYLEHTGGVNALALGQLEKAQRDKPGPTEMSSSSGKRSFQRARRRRCSTTAGRRAR